MASLARLRTSWISQHSVERGTCPCGVELLRLRYGRHAEGWCACDAISVSVGSDQSRRLPPCCRPARVGRWNTKRFRPGCVVCERAIGDGVGASFDDCWSFVEAYAHLRVGHSAVVWDEPGDDSRYFAGSARSGWACGTEGSPVVDDRSAIFGIPEPGGRDEPWRRRWSRIRQ